MRYGRAAGPTSRRAWTTQESGQCDRAKNRRARRAAVARLFQETASVSTMIAGIQQFRPVENRRSGLVCCPRRAKGHGWLTLQYATMKRAAPKDVGDYIGQFPRPVQTVLKRVRRIIRTAVPR